MLINPWLVVGITMVLGFSGASLIAASGTQSITNETKRILFCVLGGALMLGAIFFTLGAVVVLKQLR